MVAYANDTIADIKSMIHAGEGIPPETQRLIFNHTELEEQQTLSHYRVQTGSTIYFLCRLRGGKPVIYLLAPAPIPNVHVQLSLVNSWKFSALYPPATINTSTPCQNGQTVSWTVDAKPGGTLFDHGSEREAAFLFWEAQ